MRNFLVPLPLFWNNVKVFDEIPEVKYDYRFKVIQDFPNISSLLSTKITTKNFRYFFYKDLKPICSEGIRKAPKRKIVE
jgi:hypothetical protein